MARIVTKDTRNLNPGGVYFCFEGEVDGHDFIDEAMQKGAKKVYGTKAVDNCSIYEQITDVNELYVKLCQEEYNFNQIRNQLKFIGVSGTDGKTSSAIIIKEILSSFTKVAYLGTSGFYINGQKICELGMTTPFAEDFYNCVNYAYHQGCSAVVMEVSSHALVQNRLGDLEFDGVLLTNLTPEHQDFHPTMEEYCQAKLKLLDMVKPEGVRVVNADDEYFYHASLRPDVTSFSCDLGKANYQVGVLASTLEGIEFYLNHQFFKSSLIGEFNIYNLAGVIVLLSRLGVNFDERIHNVIQNLRIPGRMESYTLANGARVILDFAHTPASIEKVLAYFNQLKGNNRLIVINGCAGERDQIKRPVIGQVMDKYADIIVLTTDDPRRENVSDINEMIIQGITNKNKVYQIINREQAIDQAIRSSRAGDIIVCLGKAGQSVQYMANGAVPYSEQAVISRYI